MHNFLKMTGGAKVAHRSAVHNIAWNYIGYVYRVGINLALTAYIVRHVSVVEYGLFMFITSLSASLCFLDFGLSSILVQAYVERASQPDSNHLNELISTVFLALAALGTVGVFFSVIFAAILPGPFNIPSANAHEASIICIVAALVVQVTLPGIALEQAYQAWHRFDRVNQIQVLTSTIQIALSVSALAAGYGIVALAVVQLVSSALRLLLLAVGLPNSVPQARLSLRQFNRSLLIPLIGLSKWAFLNNLGVFLFDLLAWTLLGSLASMREAAIFGLANKLPDQLWNMIDKGANVALPFLSRSSAEGDLASLQRTYLMTQKFLFGAVLPFVVLGSVAAQPLIEVWAESQYADAAMVMQYLLLGTISHAAGYSSNQLLYACGEVKKATKITLWEYILSIVIALPLIHRFGASGLAAGMMTAQLLINFGWLTRAACAFSQITPRNLLRFVMDGLSWPLVVLFAESLIIWSISSHLPPSLIVMTALLSGCIYLGVWGIRTALPLYRGQTEIIA
ncbi:MAG: oligosaccharide flippase family protein [Acidobacteriota bacterium]|nr:oligosaccharide flippase family protein [Acidobacteriota bacterium]